MTQTNDIQQAYDEAKAKREAIDAEVVAEPTTPNALVLRPDAYAMTPTQFKDALALEKDKRQTLLDYLFAELVCGVDYGCIHRKIKTGYKQWNPCPNDGRIDMLSCPECRAKASLFKPGAEKICGLMHVAPVFGVDSETMQALGLTGKAVAFVCRLVSLNTGQVLAEGRGASDLSNDINKTIKMAQKSAQIDGVLRLAGLSAMFTQDLEDKPPTPRSDEAIGEEDGVIAAGTPAPERESSEHATSPSPLCPKCGSAMEDKRERSAEYASRGKKFPEWTCSKALCSGCGQYPKKGKPECPTCHGAGGCPGAKWPGEWPPKDEPPEPKGPSVAELRRTMAATFESWGMDAKVQGAWAQRAIGHKPDTRTSAELQAIIRAQDTVNVLAGQQGTERYDTVMRLLPSEASAAIRAALGYEIDAPNLTHAQATIVTEYLRGQKAAPETEPDSAF